MITAYVILGFGLVVTLAIGFVAMRILGDYLRAFTLSYVQERLRPKVRASVLLVISLLRWAVIAAVALFAGIAPDNGWILQLSFYFAAVVAAVVILQVVIAKAWGSRGI